MFTSIALFGILIVPLNAFPWVINGMMEAWVSINRLQRYMNLNSLCWTRYYTTSDLTGTPDTLLSFVPGGVQSVNWLAENVVKTLYCLTTYIEWVFFWRQLWLDGLHNITNAAYMSQQKSNFELNAADHYKFMVITTQPQREQHLNFCNIFGHFHVLVVYGWCRFVKMLIGCLVIQ